MNDYMLIYFKIQVKCFWKKCKMSTLIIKRIDDFNRKLNIKNQNTTNPLPHTYIKSPIFHRLYIFVYQTLKE